MRRHIGRLIALTATLAFGAAAQAQTVAISEKLHAAADYDLYVVNAGQGFCVDGTAAVAVSLKTYGPDDPIRWDVRYQGLLNGQIIPELVRQCPDLRWATINNLVEGHWVQSPTAGLPLAVNGLAFSRTPDGVVNVISVKMENPTGPVTANALRASVAPNPPRTAAPPPRTTTRSLPSPRPAEPVLAGGPSRAGGAASPHAAPDASSSADTAQALDRQLADIDAAIEQSTNEIARMTRELYELGGYPNWGLIPNQTPFAAGRNYTIDGVVYQLRLQCDRMDRNMIHARATVEPGEGVEWFEHNTLFQSGTPIRGVMDGFEVEGEGRRPQTRDSITTNVVDFQFASSTGLYLHRATTAQLVEMRLPAMVNGSRRWITFGELGREHPGGVKTMAEACGLDPDPFD